MIARGKNNYKQKLSEYTIYNKGNQLEFFNMRISLEVQEDKPNLSWMYWVVKVEYICNGKTKDLGDIAKIIHMSNKEAEYPEWLDSQLQELGFDGTINYIEMLRL